MDGWLEVYRYGEVYYEFYDQGEFIMLCCKECRDNILAKANLPLILIKSEITEYEG